MNSKLKISDFIYLALRDPLVKDKKSLAEIVCQCAKKFGFNPEEVEKELKEINKFFIASGRKGLLAKEGKMITPEEIMQPKTFKKSNIGKKIRASKQGTAAQAIGILEKNTDTFILTYGQFSLIDGLMTILDQTGPAHVGISTWTAAHGDLTKSAELLATAELLSFRMIVDRSFKTRQPNYHSHMIELFGAKSIRAIRTHAKFMIIRNTCWDIVVRTSMNLNSNPRLENMEISDNKEFAEFFEAIIDDIFNEVTSEELKSDLPKLINIKENDLFKLVSGNHIKRSTLNEPKYTHEIKEP